MVDVGQGDGMFLRTPDGHTMVVDAGFKGRGRALVSELQSRGINKIDLLVLSHPHADHIGGAIHLVKGFKVQEIWLSGAPSSTRVHLKLLKAIEQEGIPTKIVRAGHQRKLGEEVQLHVLGPEEPLLRGTRSDANANSVVLWIQHGTVDFLLTGDAEKETEQRVLEVLRARPPPDFEVLKVAHHGSRYASSEAFLARVKPKLALISCGLKNRYGHPAPETLQRLRDVGAMVFSTAQNGTFSVHSNGQKFWVHDSP
jgi:competence protein ComEC